MVLFQARETTIPNLYLSNPIPSSLTIFVILLKI